MSSRITFLDLPREIRDQVGNWSRVKNTNVLTALPDLPIPPDLPNATYRSDLPQKRYEYNRLTLSVH